MPAISVIIPCYNYGRFVEEAVDSVLASTFQDFEIVIVNDGSTDAFTNELLAKLDKPKTRVLWQSNCGLPCARNNGIRSTDSPYFLPLDADDKITPTYLEKAFWVAETHPEVAFVYPWVQFFGDSSFLWKTDGFDLDILLKQNIVSVCSLVRRSAFEEVGGYKKMKFYGYEDWNLWISLAERGWQGFRIQEPLFLYRKHGKSMMDDCSLKHKILYEEIKSFHPELFSWFRVFRIRKKKFCFFWLWMYWQIKARIPSSIKERVKTFLRKFNLYKS